LGGSGGLCRRDEKSATAASGGGKGAGFLVRENHQLGWWFQKAFAMPSPAVAASLPLTREVAKIFDF